MSIVHGEASNFLATFMQNHAVALPLDDDREVINSYLESGFVFIAGPFIKPLPPHGVLKKVYVVAKPDEIANAVHEVGMEAFSGFFKNLNLNVAK